MLMTADRLSMFRKLVVYLVLSYLGIALLKNIHTTGYRGISAQPHGIDWFMVYRQDKEQPVRMSLRYQPPHETRTFHVGRQFRVSRPQVKAIAQSFNKTFDLTHKSVTQFVFITAISDDHFSESLDAIAGMQHQFPHHKLILYDLGLTFSQVKQVRSWCRVMYRRFNFTAYPPHVKILKKYSWKALLIQEVVSEYGAFFWFDSSVRFHSNNFTALYRTALSNGGIAFMKYSPHSNFAATYKKTYEFITTDTERQKEVQQVSSGLILYYNTDKMLYNVLWWWILCSMDPYCTAPIPWTPCDFKNHDRYKEYAACHRYDQTVVNLLTSNLYGYDSRKYMSTADVTIVRYQTYTHKLLICRRE